VPLFTSGGLGLVILVFVLVLRIWSCLHHWTPHADFAGWSEIRSLSCCWQSALRQSIA